MTRHFTLCTGLVLFVAAVLGQTAAAQVDVTIRPARSSYRVGEQVLLYIRIANHGAAPIWVPTPTDFCSNDIGIGGLTLRVAPKSVAGSMTNCAGDVGHGDDRDAVKLLPRYSTHLAPGATLEVPVLADTWTPRVARRAILRVELYPMTLSDGERSKIRAANFGDVLQQRVLSNSIHIGVRR